MSGQLSLSTLPDALIVLDGDSRILIWQGTAERIFGWTEKEVLGDHIDQRLQPRDTRGNPCCAGPTPAAVRMRGVKGAPEREILVATKRGDRWVGISATYIRDASGAIQSTIAIARDVTRRKEVDLAKSEVISAVSHELRSPLTSVKGFTSTLLSRWDRFDDEMKKSMLRTINEDADRVTRLIGELLDISRLESGKLTLRPQKMSLSALAARVVERFEGGRSDKHSLVLAGDPDPAEVLADPDKVEQVVTNLVENALKYTAGGTVLVETSSTDSSVCLSVTDEGVGIPASERASVFMKFYRSDRPGNPSGTGLGLYIAKGLIETHGGRIWVEDAPSGGARFTFTLPRP